MGKEAKKKKEGRGGSSGKEVGSCDAYVQIEVDDVDTMHDEREGLRTSVVTSLNPEWRERHEIDGFKYKEGCTITLTLYDSDPDPMDSDDLIGKVEVPVPPLGGWSKEQGYPVMTEGGLAQTKAKL